MKNDSKKPQLEITHNRDYMLGSYHFLYFKNINSNTQIIKFTIGDYKGGMVNRISDFGKEQEFAFSFTLPKTPEAVMMTYIVNNTYEFQQGLFIYNHLKNLIVRPLNMEFVKTIDIG